ncbi:MAG TPA: NAD(P)/FAD-dependent oxidoreductase [Aquificales bacterium]|nr:NAD(P)/FAD-dependent oxidoreductase [Aquificales bacterium]
MSRKRVVIIGGGVGGLATAYALRDLMKELDIVLVSDREEFVFTPSLPHVAVLDKNPNSIRANLSKILPKRDIRFIPSKAEEVDPDAQRVKLANGEVLEYDYLVFATGPTLNWEPNIEIEEGAKVYSICNLPHALETREAVHKLLENPGPVVVGSIPGTSCFGPLYEFAFMLDYRARKEHIRHKIPMTIVTSEPYLGYAGLGGIGPSKRYLEDITMEKSIWAYANAKVKKVAKDHVEFALCDLDGNEIKTMQVESKLTMLMPFFEGPDVIRSAGDKVANPKGFVKTNRCMYVPDYPNIYGVGICVAIPPVQQTPIPTGAPKTGQMIEGMAVAVAHNIYNDIKNIPERVAPRLPAICIADFGDKGFFVLTDPVLPPRQKVIWKEGRWAHWMKEAFEKYFMAKVKYIKNITPWFEELGLKVMFDIEYIEPCHECSGPTGSRC